MTLLQSRKVEFSEIPVIDLAQLGQGLKGQMDGMKQALAMAGGKLWGAATPKSFADLEQVFLETKVLKQKSANPANYLIGIPNFFEKVNDFDHAAIVKQAQECKIP